MPTRAALEAYAPRLRSGLETSRRATGADDSLRPRRSSRYVGLWKVPPQSPTRPDARGALSLAAPERVDEPEWPAGEDVHLRAARRELLGLQATAVKDEVHVGRQPPVALERVLRRDRLLGARRSQLLAFRRVAADQCTHM